MPRLLLAAVVGLLVLSGCSDAPPLGPYGDPEPVPALTSAPLTDAVTLAPATPRLEPADERSPSSPDQREEMLAEGYGEEVEGPGEPHVTVGTATTPGASPQLLVRFAHLPDIQLTDDESPTRFALFDAPELTSSAYRPQEAYGCHLLNAMVRTLNTVHATSPLDFVLLGGDNIDNAQQNELDWVLALLTGAGLLECDSGEDDDPVYGANNDPKDAFYTIGLEVPWYWVMGNHDVLQQGNFVIDPDKVAASMGESATYGTVDWSRDGAPVVSGAVAPDPDRRHLYPDEVVEAVKAHDDGHGLADLAAGASRANYYFDVTGTPLRFIVHDTTSEVGSSEALIRTGDIMMGGALFGLLEQALTDGKWVILASHHAASSLDGTFGSGEPDAISAQDWIDFLSNYPHVLFSIVAHSHQNRVLALTGAGPNTVYEIMTSALADHPHQARVLELWDQNNGALMLRATNVDFQVEGYPLAAEGRALGVLDHVAGWVDPGEGAVTDRNVEIWVPAPVLP